MNPLIKALLLALLVVGSYGLPGMTGPEIRAAEISIGYDVPQAGRVSLAVYDAQGRLVRTLLTGEPHAPGHHTASWDGLDRYGRPLPPAIYQWKMLASQGLRAEFITQVGQNPEPIWEKHVGNHAPPHSSAADDAGVYRIGGTNEGAHWGVKTDRQGKVLWTNDRQHAEAWESGGAALTTLKGQVFELLGDGGVYGYEAATGQVFTNSNHDPKPWNFRWKGFQAGNDTPAEARVRQHSQQAPADLAADSARGLLVACYPRHDGLHWFDPTNGNLVDTLEAIKQPVAVAVTSEGDTLVITEGQVVRLSRNPQEEPVTVIPADRLQNPWRLCVSPQSGEIYVAENSALATTNGEKPAPHHQVKRFSPAGELLQTYGQPAGRADGAYSPADFRNLTDIEADPQGGFLITEGNHTPPRRAGRFDTQGNLLHEWYGAQHYGVIACPEPNDPRHVWTLANADVPGLIRWEVDYDKKTSRLAEIYQDSFAQNKLLRNNAAHGSMVPSVFEYQGRTYISNGSLGSLTLRMYDPATQTLRACNVSGFTNGRSFLWNDLNDDGQATEDEIDPSSRGMLGGYINPADFSLLTSPHGTRFQPPHVLKPSRFTAGGTPVFLWSEAKKLAPWTENGQQVDPFDFRQGPDGSWYGCFADRVSNPNESHENHGAWYYNSCSALDRLVKWDRNWNPLWSVGRHSPDNDHETGSTAMPRGLVGLTHGCVVWGDASDEEVCRPTVWTEDGLYVDELLRIPTDDLPKELYGQNNTNEYPVGHLASDPATGNTYYYALNSAGGAPIYRISGWEGWHRQQGNLQLDQQTESATFARRDGKGLTAQYFNSPDCQGQPAFTRTDKVVYFNWGKEAPDPKITADLFSVRWSGTYEAATNEPLRFEVRGHFPWRDPGKPLWAKLWLDGQLVLDATANPLTPGNRFDEQQHSQLGAVRVKLQAGQRVEIKLECGFKKGAAAVALSTDTPSLDRRAIMPSFLHPESLGESKLHQHQQSIEIVADEPRPLLLAHFDFENPEGFLHWSKAGGDIFGRLTGPARLVRGPHGNAVEFTPGGPYAPAPFPIVEELRVPDTNYTIAFWFKSTDANVRLCEARRYSSYNNRWSDHKLSLQSGKLLFELDKVDPLLTADKVNDGNWHHVVTTVGATGQKLYLDGRLQATGKLTRRARTSNRLGLDIGPASGPATLTIDEVKVYSRALDPAEIASTSPR